MLNKNKGQLAKRFTIYFSGLLLMALGFVLLIRCDLGATPWDVLHVGLYIQFGLTVGTWSIIVGLVILSIAAIVGKQPPKIGTVLNMLFVGVFMDFYLMLSFLQTPHTAIGKIAMLLIGIVLTAYGIGLYISAGLGAGPRDSMMVALTDKTNWKVRDVRAGMEIGVLIIGWQLGGPVSWGTFAISILIGPVLGFAMPQTSVFTDIFLNGKAQLKRNVDI